MEAQATRSLRPPDSKKSLIGDALVAISVLAATRLVHHS